MNRATRCSDNILSIVTKDAGKDIAHNELMILTFETYQLAGLIVVSQNIEKTMYADMAQ